MSKCIPDGLTNAQRYQLRHPDRIKLSHQKYYRKNKKACNAASSAYYWNNKEQYLAHAKQYRTENQDRLLAAARARYVPRPKPKVPAGYVLPLVAQEILKVTRSRIQQLAAAGTLRTKTLSKRTYVYKLSDVQVNARERLKRRTK